MRARQIAIYGGGGFAREVAWLVQTCNVGSEAFQVVCFVDDNLAAQGSLLNEFISASGYTLARVQSSSMVRDKSPS